MVQSNPSYSLIDRFIVTDSSFSSFLQVGSNSISEGRPLRSDYLISELAHVDEEEGIFSGPYFSDLSYGKTRVIGMIAPIIDYNTGLTLGYVYTAISLDRLLAPLYSYQEIDDSPLVIAINGRRYMVEEDSLEEIVEPQAESMGKAVLEGDGFRVQRNGKSYSLTLDTGYFSVQQGFEGPSILTDAPLLLLVLILALLMISVTIVLSLYLNRAIYYPIRRLSKRIEKIQHGDFTSDAGIDTEDEFGIIGRGINKLSSEVTDLMDKRVEDEKTKLKLEYRVLQNQINPHFLYNTFNSIRLMAKIQGAKGIDEMVTSLARLMKNISKREESIVKLSDEVDFIDDYMVIMKYRYGNTISYIKSISPECSWVTLPRFTLQPLVENAIFHGIEPKGTGAISIIAEDFGSYSVIMVADNGVGFQGTREEKHDGVFRNIGIRNIEQRLDYATGGKAKLEITSWPDAGTICRIKVEH